MKSSAEAIGSEISGEIGLVEQHETVTYENNNYLHRIDYVSKLKRNVLPCASEEILMERAISNAESTTEEDGSIVYSMDSFQDVNIFCKRCMMHENNLQGSFHRKEKFGFIHWPTEVFR